jgi:hypothetical protein
MVRVYEGEKGVCIVREGKGKREEDIRLGPRLHCNALLCRPLPWKKRSLSEFAEVTCVSV